MAGLAASSVLSASASAGLGLSSWGKESLPRHSAASLGRPAAVPEEPLGTGSLAPAVSAAANATATSKAFPTLGAAGAALLAQASFEEVMRDLPEIDIKALHTAAHKRSRRVLRCLSYPALPSGGQRDGDRRAVSASTLLSRAAKVPDKVQPLAPPLELALQQGPDSRLLRGRILVMKQGLAEDGADAVCQSGASLECVDTGGLTQDLDNDRETFKIERGAAAAALAIAADILAPEARAQDIAGAGEDAAQNSRLDKPRSASLTALMRPHPAFARRHWPSLAKFEQYYHPEESLPPMPPRPAAGERLPSGRKSIARLEDARVVGAQRPLLLGSLPDEAHERTPADLSPGKLTGSAEQRPKKPAGLFEAVSLYRQACKQLSTAKLTPAPLFGERLEVRDIGADGTRQCYALAEGIRASAPREVALPDAFLTDMGASRIVEAAIMAGRLRSLSISGSFLSYRTCTALYVCMRTRGGASLVELSLAQCGLGADLDMDPEELPSRAAAAYARSRAALLGAAAGGAAEDGDEGDLELGPAGGSAALLEHLGEAALSEEAHLPPEEASSRPDNRQALGRSETPLLLPVLALLARPGCALRRLDLSRSALSVATARYLDIVLATTLLETLVLNHCCLVDECLEAVAGGLAKNQSLLDLQLRCNQFSGSPGATTALLDAAGRHARLAHLDFAQNLLSSECIEDLCAAFHWSCSLVAVHILGAPALGREASAAAQVAAAHNAARIAAACRRWVAAQGSAEGTPVEAAPGQAEDDGASSETPSWAASETEEEDAGDAGEAGSEEMILCRALHVDGLHSWRVALPEPSRPASAAVLGAPAQASRSWMPACCWICDRSTAVDYNWVVPDSGPGDDTGTSSARLYVRTSFADFARVEMRRQRVPDATRVLFSARLLVPPGSHCHVFEAQVGTTTKLLHAAAEPTVELAEAQLTATQRDTLEGLCRQHRYIGQLNTIPCVSTDGFAIPDTLSSDGQAPTEDADPWAEDPTRRDRLRRCYEVDMGQMHIGELCHAAEEEEVRATFLELYGCFYEAYAIFAGRSQWPLVRQVDVYGFFDEVRLLDRGQMALATVPEPSSPSSPSKAEAGSPGLSCSPARPLMLQDVQQMIVQTIAYRQAEVGRGRPQTLFAKQAAVVVQRTREGEPITRPQFMEVLVRSAIALRGRDPSTAQALRRFVDEILSARIMQPPFSPFPRGLSLQVGEVCDTLLSQRKTLREAWERFGGSADAFQRLSQLLRLCDRSFTAKHVASIFALSRRPQPNFKKCAGAASGLRYDEFREAVLRLALVWKRASRFGTTSPGGGGDWPPQPKFGRPVRQRAVAARLEAFLAKLAERMKPAVVANHSIFSSGRI